MVDVLEYCYVCAAEVFTVQSMNTDLNTENEDYFKKFTSWLFHFDENDLFTTITTKWKTAQRYNDTAASFFGEMGTKRAYFCIRIAALIKYTHSYTYWSEGTLTTQF